ncbi:MAG TPA: sporulation protein [Cerasibacillus sp.]|uniref:sporulation protein n=1 Tax=Cerasibacillus sp. TaxID=2498711 RepID=UPI002F41268F
MSTIEQTLLYLRESLANYVNDNKVSKKIYLKLRRGNYKDERDFVEDLTEREVSYLNKLLAQEMHYAKNNDDQVRLSQLNEIYELLY